VVGQKVAYSSCMLYICLLSCFFYIEISILYLFRSRWRRLWFFLALWVVSIYFYADIAGCQLFHSASFVIPDSRIILIPFCLEVPVLMYLFCIAEFYVLLTVHLRSILVNKRLDAHFFFSIYLFKFSTRFEHPYAHDQENQLY